MTRRQIRLVTWSSYIGNYHSSHRELRRMALSSVQPIPCLQDMVSSSKESTYKLSPSDHTAIPSATAFQSIEGDVGTYLGVPSTLHSELPSTNSASGEPGEQLGSITMSSTGTNSDGPRYGTGKLACRHAAPQEEWRTDYKPLLHDGEHDSHDDHGWHVDHWNWNSPPPYNSLDSSQSMTEMKEEWEAIPEKMEQVEPK